MNIRRLISTNEFFNRILISLLLRLNIFFGDKLYLKLLYRLHTGKRLDFRNPKSFTEKLQWLKVYNRKPEYTTMVDKYAVKEYVASKIGAEYIIPTLGVWNTPDEIEWDKLPNQFVLKTTHGGGSAGVAICLDKGTLDKTKVLAQLKKSYKTNLYRYYREWPYKNVPKRIIAEKFMSETSNGEETKDLADFKFFCFDGEPKYCQVIRDRSTKESIDFYDMDWNHMPFVGLNPIASNGLVPVPKPTHLTDMIDICRKLAKGIPFSRIDLYVINSKEYFGEITFYPASGFGVFSPEEWSLNLGKLIDLQGVRSVGGV